MFVVYSPDGRNLIGSVSRPDPTPVTPVIKADPIEKDVLDGPLLDPKSMKGARAGVALHAYQVNQEEQKRRVIVKASEIMVSPVVLVSDENTVEEAWNMMQESGVHYLPVMRSGALVGMCTEADLLGRVIVDQLGVLEGVKPDLVGDVMHSEVITTGGDTDIRHVAMVLAEYDVGALLILSEQGEVQGIVTRTDLIKRLANDPPVELYV